MCPLMIICDKDKMISVGQLDPSVAIIHFRGICAKTKPPMTKFTGPLTPLTKSPKT